MCLICIQCGELNEDPCKRICETCQQEEYSAVADWEARMEYDEGWECADCRERGGECLPCKIAREDWVVTPLANGKVKYAD